ncbi:MAG: hypothetical protein HRT35_03715, partial [Algicola sp.]|nr:hypothetical protein [Algicola sp.]
SVGLFNGSFVYKDGRNRIMLNSQKQSLTTGWHSPILQPTSSANSNKIAFYSGHLYQWNIHSYDTNSAQGKQLTFNIAANRFPVKTADNFYYSSDFTGITQIYRLSDDGKGKPIQLINFKKNRRATHISVSPNGKMLAISYISRTDCYRLTGDSLKLVKQFEDLIYPSFSLDSKKVMLFKTDDKPEQTSIEFNLNSWQRTGITIPQSQFAIYHRRGIIFTKTGNKGIYLFNNGTTTTINDSITLYTPADISAADDFLYAVDKSDNRVKKIAISGEDIDDLPIKNVGQLYHYKGIIYYTLEQMGKTSIYVGDIVER